MTKELTEQGISKTKACRLSGLPRRSLYYCQKKRTYSPEQTVCNEITQLCRQRPLYGYRRITAMLKRNGHLVNKKKVHRIMKELGFLHKKPVHRPHWQINKGGQIASLPDIYWQADMTKIWCGYDGWGYLFNVIDCCYRGWLGYHFSPLCSTNESLKSIQEALKNRAPQTMAIAGLRLGTDAGSQFTSRKFEKSTGVLGMIHQVSRRHTPEDDGVIESFHKTLKAEYIWPHEFESFAQAEEAIKNAFYDYNYERIHSGLAYKTPNEYLMEVTGKGLCLEAMKCVQK